MIRWSMVAILVGCGEVRVEPPIADADMTDADMVDAAMVDAAMVDAAPTRWALVQARATEDPRLTVDKLGEHHLIVVAVGVFNGGRVTSVTDSSNCNSYVAIQGARATNAGDGLEIYHARDSCAGATQIRVTSTDQVAALVAWEVSGIRTDDPVDAASGLSDQPESMTPTGPRITTSAAGAFVVSAVLFDFAVSGVLSAEFTSDHIVNGNGFGHLADPAAMAGTYQARWQALFPGAYCASAAAFRVAP